MRSGKERVMVLLSITVAPVSARTFRWPVPSQLASSRVYSPQCFQRQGSSISSGVLYQTLRTTYLTGWVRIGCRCSCTSPLHASLTPDQRQVLRDLRREPELRPRVRLRVECLLLSAGGMKVSQLAAHLDCCEATVHTLLHRFAAEGVAYVREQPRGVRPDRARRQ